MATEVSSRGARFEAMEDPSFRDRSCSASAMASLFEPLDRLLGSGGDPRISIDPISGLNEYGFRLSPCPDVPSFASSTATSWPKGSLNAISLKTSSPVRQRLR